MGSKNETPLHRLRMSSSSPVGINGRAINDCRKLGLISVARKRHESKETIAEQKMGWLCAICLV